MAHLLQLNVDKIIIYPLGGITKINMDVNTSNRKEFLVLINGPLFQWIGFFLLLLLLPREKKFIISYHFLLLFFNLLPIYPLDGGKLVLLLLDSFLPFKRSLFLVTLISYLLMIPLLVRMNLKKGIGLITIFFLGIMITKEKKKIPNIWYKFLIERTINDYHFKRNRIVNRVEDFYKEKNHILYKDGKYYTERDFLRRHLQKKLEK